MFSVIIPTIWSPTIESIDKLIDNLTCNEKISEIILINNNPSKYSNRYIHNKRVKELSFDNIYVNQAWNIGVSESNSEFICLMNDDIDFNTNIFQYIIEGLKNSDVKLAGVSKSCYSLEKDEEYKLEKVSIRNRGWGCLIFTKKEYYTPIPSDLKIHFGDDYLINQLKGSVWKIEGLKITSEISILVLMVN